MNYETALKLWGVTKLVARREQQIVRDKKANKRWPQFKTPVPRSVTRKDFHLDKVEVTMHFDGGTPPGYEPSSMDEYAKAEVRVRAVDRHGEGHYWDQSIERFDLKTMLAELLDVAGGTVTR